MSTLTKEWLLKTIAELEEERDATPGAVNEDAAKALEAMKLALASLEAEPIGYMNRFTGRVFTLEEQPGADTDAQVYVPFYTAPPAPVLPRDLEEIIFSIVNAMADEKLRDDESELFSLAKKYIEHAKSKLGAAMLQGAEPVTTANKLRDAVEIIRNSGIEIGAEKIFAERDALNAPDCWCRACRPITLTDMRFVVCPDCGNKRCPHANDHRNGCTGSNEPGQEGSAYPAAPQQEAKNV